VRRESVEGCSWVRELRLWLRAARLEGRLKEKNRSAVSRLEIWVVERAGFRQAQITPQEKKAQHKLGAWSM
jgi:hypothetical protein